MGGFGSPSIEHPDSGNGVMPEIGTVNVAWVVDGLSHTAACSERLRGSNGSAESSRLDRERDMFALNTFTRTADDLLVGCRIAARPNNPRTGFVLTGKSWFWTGTEQTLYNHAEVPNGRVPDCAIGGSMTHLGMTTARSAHHGGVNVGMCDGSVRFVSETVAEPVWRGFGTRNGGELVD